MKYKVKNIGYSIEPNDILGQFDENDFALYSDLIEACEKRIDEIEENLPSEMIVIIDDEMDKKDVNDEICNIISDKTGWPVINFEYEK